VRKLLLLLIVLAAVELGCSPEPESADPTNDPDSSGVLLTFTRSGGFAGTTETITVQSDGRVEFEGDAAPPQTLELPPELLNRLEEELQDLDWERAAKEPANVVCSDCFTYDIRAGGQQVTTTGLGQSGQELSDFLALIEEIFANSSGR